MNFLKHVCVLICLLLVIAKLAKAQNPSDEVKKIRQTYEKTNRFSTDVSYKIFTSHYAASPIETSQGHYKKKGKEYNSNIDGIITLQNNKLILVVDPEQQSIIVADPGKVKGVMEGMALDTLLSVYTHSRLSKLDSKNNRLTLTFTKKEEENATSAIEKIEVYYNSVTYLMYKFVLFYGEPMRVDEKSTEEKPRLEISFSNVNIQPGFDKNTFSESIYFVEKENKLLGVNDYQAYQIIDQRIKK